jgi:hypothetical protein
MLRHTLQSIRIQSKKEYIATIIVSENSDDQRSAQVVAAFPDLPISYITQDPALDAYQHFAALLQLVNTDWVAFLGDDDLWGRYHLEEAMRCLAGAPDAIAYLGRDVIFRDDYGINFQTGHYLPPVKASHESLLTQGYQAFTPEDMHSACLLSTPLNMWTLVGKTPMIREAFRVFTETRPGSDCDRYMLWTLSQLGKILVGREISLFYRKHAENAYDQMLAEDYRFHQEKAAAYTNTMISRAEQQLPGWKTAWTAMTERMSDTERSNFWRWAIPGAKQALKACLPQEVSRLNRQTYLSLFHVARTQLKKLIR